MSYGGSAYGTSTYGGGTSGAYGTLTVVAPAASATASMTAPSVILGVAIAAPPATATASMTAPRVRLTSLFAAYDLDANASQAMQVRVELSGVLEANPIPVPPPTPRTEEKVRASRRSLVMPDPTLDDKGWPT